MPLPSGQNTEFGSPNSTYTVSGIVYDRVTGSPLTAPKSIDHNTPEKIINQYYNPGGKAAAEENSANSTTSTEEERKTIKTRAPKRPLQPTLRYPSEILNDFTDYLQINVVEYSSSGKRFEQGIGFEDLVGKPGSRKNTGRKLIRSIILPIPSNVQDGNTVNYEDSRLNGLTGAVASAASDLMNVGFDNLGRDIAGIAGRLGGNLGGTGTAQDLLNKFFVSQAAGLVGGNLSVNSLLAREQGAIFNPNMELLFNGPTIRSFRFQFKMTPRSQKEGQEVRQIIREFKRSMAPKVTAVGNSDNNNLFLKTPDVFELTYRQGKENHKFLNKFKQCVLQDISVNYTGEGTYATYDDGTPVSMIMDLTFKELEPIYDTDYYTDKNDNNLNGVNLENTNGVGY